MADDCLKRLLDPEVKQKLFGERDVPDSVIKRVVQDIETIKKNFDNGTIERTEYKTRVNQYISERQRLDEIQTRMRAENLRKVREVIGFVSQPGFEKDPSEGFKALLAKSTTLANKANQSIYAMAGARLEKWGNYMSAELERTGTAKVFFSGQIDKEVYVATESFASGKQPPAGLPKEAIEVGRIINDINRLLYKDMQNAGIPVRDLSGRVTRQTHDIGKIRSIGFESWFTKVMPMVDQVKTFGVNAGDPQAMQKIMQKIYNSIVSGQYGIDSVIGDTEVGDHFVGLGATKSLADKLSEARTLHFAGPENTYNYNAEFGRANLAQSVYLEMRRNARSVSLFERLGDQPKAALEANIDRMINKLKNEGSLDKAEKLSGEKSRIMDLYAQLTGATSIPGSATKAKIGQAISTMETLSKLWNVGLRSAANFAGTVVEVKNATGKNILDATIAATKGWLDGFPESARATWASKGADFLRDMQHQMLNESDIGSISKGGNKLVRFMMKYNGQDFMNAGFSNAVSISIQKEMADQAAKGFKQLEPKMQASLLSAGFEESDWKVLGQALETMPDGRVMVTPEGITNLSDEALKGSIPPKMSAERYRADLELKLRAYLIQASDVATTTAGPRELSIITQGTQVGTNKGEFLRMLGRFKSFMFQSMNIGKKFLNSNPNAEMLEKGVLMSEGKDLRSLGEWIIMGSVLAYGADSLIRASTGKEPKDPASAKTWMDAMAKSGAGAAYVDFFVQNWDYYDAGANLILGPTLGQVSTLGKIVTNVKKGDTDDAAMNSTRMIRNYIPFQQAVGMKQGLDYLQYDIINETLRPGANAKRQLRELRAKYRGEGE